jgi:Golgi SNAP receptor complex protein 1
MSSDFDSMRREASRLERQLEDRISKYQQLAQRIITTNSTADNHSSSLLGRSSAAQEMEGGTMSNNIQVLFMEETKLSADIERMLQAFKEQNDRMASAATRSQHHILVKRCREITYDFQSDYNKVRHGVQRRKDTLELFNGASGNGAKSQFQIESGSGDGDSGDMEHLLRERNHITNSTNATKNILGQAGETYNELKNQRRALTGVTGNLVSMAQAIPGVNRVIEQVRAKRNKDDLIVAGVIAGCILFTLWYVFS